MYYIFFIHSSVHGHLYCFHVLAIVNSTGFVWFCVFFSGVQVLLPSLSWCYAGASVSEGVFLMYPWREMYSTSTYSPAIFKFAGRLFII